MASGTVSENIGKLSNETVLFVEWKIQNFFSLPHEVDHRIHSRSFHFAGANWYIRLYPNGDAENDSAGHIDIYLMKQTSSSLTHRVNYHLGISEQDGSDHFTWRGEKDFGGNSRGWGVFKLVKRSKVCDECDRLAPNGVVTVFCYLQLKSGGRSDASTQTALHEDNDQCNEAKQESLNDEKKTGAHKLSKNLEDLLLSKEACDITLKVQSQEFQAHKAILVARSSVFSSMFRHEMAEKLSGEVDIPDCEPDAFHIFLIYLYTGTVEGLSSDNVFNVYAIANKYDATELTMNCREYMKSSLSVETFCDVLTLSLMHNETDLLDMATDFFKRHFTDIIITVKWQSFLQENSTVANELLIKISKYYAPPK